MGRITLLLSAAAVVPLGQAIDLSGLEVRRIAIEKRWDRPVPTKVPEVPVVLRDAIFYGNEPNHPTIGPEEKPYHPIRAGGFWKQNGTRYFNRPLFYRGSMVGTGDLPMFLITRGYGKQWAAKLRFAFSRGNRSKWLDKFESVRTEFWPGRVEYRCEDQSMGLSVRLTAAAGMEGWSSLFAIEVGGQGADLDRK